MSIPLTNRTRNRRTFAKSALHAARRVLDRRRWHCMDETLGLNANPLVTGKSH